MGFSEEQGRFERCRQPSSGRGAVLFVCIGLMACSPPSGSSAELGYTQAPGTIDETPISAFGDLSKEFPPEPNGSPYDSTKGKGVQAYSDAIIGKRVADFVSHHVVHSMLPNDEFHHFYTIATGGPGPGMCQARVYSVMSNYTYRIDKPATRASIAGEWSDNVFAVAGSVAPLPKSPHPRYAERLDSACQARRDMAVWFSSDPKTAVTAARLADMIVNAARQPEQMPFALICRPFPSDFNQVPFCQGDVRKTVASLNPRAIVRVDECFEIKERPCLAVSIAKFPDVPSSADEQQWTLNVQYNDQSLNVVRVDVDDTQIIVE